MANNVALVTDDVSLSENIAENADSPAYKILLVDDEPNILDGLKRLFRKENYQIITASNGKEALSILENHSCQLIISDYRMPVMDGATLLREAKKLYPNMIRLLLSGDSDTKAIVSAVKEGAVYKFILKPCNEDDLLLTVGLALEQYELRKSNKALQDENQEKNKEIDTLKKLAGVNRSQLAIMLHERNLLSEQQLNEAHRLQQVKDIPILKLILEQGWISEQKIYDILCNDLMFSVTALQELEIDPKVAALLPHSLCKLQSIIPLRLEGSRRLVLVMSDPMDLGLINEVRSLTELEIETTLGHVKEIDKKVHETYCKDELDNSHDQESYSSHIDRFDDTNLVIEDDIEKEIGELIHSLDDSSITFLINKVILEAIRLRASDIHIQPLTKGTKVRFRINGVLVDKVELSQSLHKNLVDRIKAMASLDEDECNLPQQSRISVKIQSEIIDLTISTLHTLNGEKVTIHILIRHSEIPLLEEIGLSEKSQDSIKKILSRPQGIILSVGPMGSGKTTTLYSMLQAHTVTEKNYITVEDTVNYHLITAEQVMACDKTGLDLFSMLRAALHHDPDVILLGKIINYKTAKLAFEAAQSGKLFFSSLQTTSTIGTITHLIDLGLKPHLIATALEAIIAQRLVRKICENCKTQLSITPENVKSLGIYFSSHVKQYFSGEGCDSCNNTGYAGCTGLYEVFTPSHEMRQLISSGASTIDLTKLSENEKQCTLIQDAYRLVNNGVTTVDEILRILGPQNITSIKHLQKI